MHGPSERDERSRLLWGIATVAVLVGVGIAPWLRFF